MLSISAISMYIFFLSSCSPGAEESSLAVCSSPLPPALGSLPVVQIPQRGMLPQQGTPSSHSNFFPWLQQEPEPTVTSQRSLQSKTHQVRSNALLSVKFTCNSIMEIYILHILTSCQGQLLQMKFAHSFSLSNKEKLDLWEETLSRQSANVVPPV